MQAATPNPVGPALAKHSEEPKNKPSVCRPHLSTKHSKSRKRLSQVLVTTLSTILEKGAVSLGATSPVFASDGPKKRSIVSSTPDERRSSLFQKAGC